MDIILGDFLIKTGASLVAGLLTGSVVAFFTARYALKRFYKEKWWEKKLNAFLEVTENIYKIKRAEDYWLAKEESKIFKDDSFQQLSPEEEELRTEYSSGRKELTRISHLSSLTLSKKASMLLLAYISEYEKIYPSWWEDEISSFDVTVKSDKLISDLLKEIIIEAKKELKIDG